MTDIQPSRLPHAIDAAKREGVDLVVILAAERGTTVHALVCEGLNAVFAKHRRPKIAK